MRGKSVCRLVLVILIAAGMPLLSVGAAAKPAGIAWMVLYYLAGDTDLEVMCLHDLEELQSAPHDRVKTLAMIDRATNWEGAADSNARYYDVVEGSMVLKGDCGEVNMGAPESLSDFIIWAMTSYMPAKHYALIIVDHGGGWHGVCYESGDWLTMTDLHLALDTAKVSTGIVFDVIGFDACQMAYLEVAYQIKDYAKVMVSSQDFNWYYDASEPGDPPVGTGGFPNDAIITHLSGNYRTDAAGFASIIVNDYADFWEDYQPEVPNYPGQDQTISAVYLDSGSRMTKLMNAMLEFSLALQERIPTYETEIMACRAGSTADLGNFMGIDLYHFVDLIDAQNMAETRTMKKAMGSIRMSIESMAFAEWHEVLREGIAHGLNIFFPPDYAGYQFSCPPMTPDGYSSNDFCQSAGGACWDNFLRDILNYPA